MFEKTLKKKIILAFLMLTLLFAGIFAYNIYVLNSTNVEIEASEENLEQFQLAKNINHYHTFFKDVVNSFETFETKQGYHNARAREYGERIIEFSQEYDKSYENSENLKELSSNTVKYGEKILTYYNEGDKDLDLTKAQDNFRENADKLSRLLYSLENEPLFITSYSLETLNETLNNNFIFGIVALFLFILSVFWIGKSTINDIDHILETIKAITSKLAKGNLAFEIYHKEKDTKELSKILEYLVKLKKNLNKIVQNIKDNNLELNSSAEELSASTQESNALVESSENNINLLTNSIDELWENNKKIKEISKETRKLSGIGVEKIEEANEQIEDINSNVIKTKKTIEELNESSKEVSKITELIEGIADQTNLLALNAAIEAARAGEAGRGFAVVAEEIRELATQTASSIEDINNIIKKMLEKSNEAQKTIGETFEESKEGKKLVEDSSKTFKDISKEIEKTDKEVSSVNSLVDDMHENSEVVNSSVNDIKAMSREISQSSNSLRDLSENLSDLIKKFELDKEGENYE